MDAWIVNYLNFKKESSKVSGRDQETEHGRLDLKSIIQTSRKKFQRFQEEIKRQSMDAWISSQLSKLLERSFFKKEVLKVSRRDQETV